MTKIDSSIERPLLRHRLRCRHGVLRSCLVAWVFGMLAGVPAKAAAATALTFTGGDLLRTQGLVVGWRFSVSTSVTISSLGFYDLGGDGLNVPYHIGIYDSNTRDLKVSALVADGIAAPLSDGFRYSTSLSGSAVLPMGDYVIAARGASDYPTDDLARFQVPVSGVLMAPEVTCGAGVYLVSPGLAFPTTVYYGSGWGIFGANFQYASAVPEPGSAVLLVLGLLMARGRRSR